MAEIFQKNKITEDARLQFFVARGKALAEERDTHLVGTLGEKPIHRTLKYFVEPDSAKHEVKHRGFIADAVSEEGIFEVQTCAFERLVPKLDCFLNDSRVTVAFPVIKERRLFWIAPEDGAISAPRKVSKKGKISDILPELSKIRKFIGNENFSLCIYTLAADEYRMLDGYGAEKKKRATKYTLIPTDIFEVYELCGLGDYQMLIPDKLPDVFSAKEFYSAIGMRGRRAYFALNFLREMGFIKTVGKSGNVYLYQKDKLK